MIFPRRVHLIFRAALFVLSLGTMSNSLAFSNTFADLFFDVEQQKNSSKNRAAAKAQSQHGGKVLSVKEYTTDGRTHYKVKLLLDSGRIKIVRIKGD
ncbi:MAG: hypothetical protein K6L80_09915 [Agarilytica sp.]